MNSLNMNPEVGLIVTGFLFGFGFAIAQWVWSALVSLVNRPRKPDA
jgi:hypothetical protein